MSFGNYQLKQPWDTTRPLLDWLKLQTLTMPIAAMDVEQQEHSFITSSVQSLSCVPLFGTPLTAACQASLSITNSLSCLSSCPSSRWCHSTISSSAVPFSSCLQAFPVSGSFPMSQFLSGCQSIGASASASVLPMNIQDWFPLGLICLISLQSKELSRVFNTIIQKHQFFNTQLS